jgi:phage terminase large subunit-like protein
MGFRGIGAKSLKSKTAKRRVRVCENYKLCGSDRVLRFIPSLKLTAGEYAGKPFRLRPFQQDIVRGIYREVDGDRPVRTALATMGRKNGKTELAAALAAAHLFGPMAEPRGEVYSAASDRNQSGRIFRELEAIIYADSDLTNRCNIQRFAKKIEVLSGPGAGSIYEALSSDARKAHSLSPSFVVCDELAQWPSRDLYDNLVTGTGARKRPLVVVISTMSSNPNDVMTELVNYGEQVNAGIVDDPSFVAFIYTMPMDLDVWDEKNWYLANPALGDFRELDEMRKFAAQAKRIPAKEAVFRNLYQNQPVERTTALRLIPRADWDACALKQADVDALPELLKGRLCYGGLDLSEKNDLTAFALVFPFDDHVIVTSKFWTRDEQLEQRSTQDKASYPLWVKQQHLNAVAGRVIDYEFVAKEIAAHTNAYQLQGIACDPWQLEKFEKACKDIGADHLKLMKHGQGFKDLDPAVRATEDLALKWALRHDGNPVMTWCNDNVRIVMDAASNRKFDKMRSKGRIDGVVALAMAVNLSASQTSVSEPQLFFVG